MSSLIDLENNKLNSSDKITSYSENPDLNFKEYI